MPTTKRPTASFLLGQLVRVDHVDMNGLCGRDPHPNESHEGCIGTIIASCIDEMPVPDVAKADAFELACRLVHLSDDDEDGCTLTFLHTVLLETPGGDELFVFADYELAAL